MTRRFCAPFDWAMLGMMMFSSGIALLFGFWLLIDNKAPVTLFYQYPHPLSAPASSRVEAEALRLDIIHPGQTWYRYQEYCLSRPTPGTRRALYEDTGVILMPLRTNLGRAGCFKRSFITNTPEWIPSGRYQYLLSIDYEINPLITKRFEFPPIPVLVQ